MSGTPSPSNLSPPPTSSHSSPTSVPPTSSPHLSSPTSVPGSVTVAPHPSPPVSTPSPTPSPSLPPPSSPPLSSQPAPPSNSGPSSNGGQPTSLIDGSSTTSLENNADSQTMQSGASFSVNSGSSQSTWVTVYSSTPTTMTFATMTTVGGSAFDTTFAVTTFFGGQTSTMSSNDASITGSSSGNSAAVHSSNHVGAVVGSIAGAIVVAVFFLFMCKVYYNRRTVRNQERQMAESWLSRPFSRAATHRYRDIDMPLEVPAAYGHRNSYQDAQHENVNDSFAIRPLSPTSPMSPMSFPALKPAPKSLDVQSVSAPVGALTMHGGNPTAFHPALESGPSSSQPQDSFFERFSGVSPHASSLLSSGWTPRSSRNVSNYPEAENDRDDRDIELSRPNTVTNDSVIFSRPPSGSSSISGYQWPTDRYGSDPFSDHVSSTGTPSNGTLMDQGRFSGESTARSVSTARNQGYAFDAMSFDGGARSVRGPNLTALMNEARGD